MSRRRALAAGRTASALEIQREYYTRAIDFVERSGGDEDSGLLGRGRDGRASEAALDQDGELARAHRYVRERSSRCCVLELGNGGNHQYSREQMHHAELNTV